MIGLIGGGVTLVLALIVGLVMVVIQPDSHAVSTPNSAAGLTRDPNLERSIGTETMKNRLVQGSKGQVKKAVGAVYASSATKVLFIGGETESDNAESFADNFRSSASDIRAVTDTGEFDGKSLCGRKIVNRQSAVSCVWADNDTFGQFVMLTGDDISELADVMTRIRPQLEKKT